MTQEVHYQGNQLGGLCPLPPYSEWQFDPVRKRSPSTITHLIRSIITSPHGHLRFAELYRSTFPENARKASKPSRPSTDIP